MSEKALTDLSLVGQLPLFDLCIHFIASDHAQGVMRE